MKKATLTAEVVVKSRGPGVGAPRDEGAHIQVIAKAASVLRALEDEDEGLSLGKIASRVGLPRSTVQRIVAALESEKLVVSASSAGGWRLGPALIRMASSVKVGVSAIVRPIITELSAELKETVDISTPKKDGVIFVDQIVGSQRLRTVSGIGEVFPMYCTANGKAFLAHLSDDEVTQRIGRKYPSRTSQTHTTFKDLRADLDQVRKLGYSVDNEEHTLGVAAIGVMVKDSFGNPVLISVPVPFSRFESRKQAIIEKVLAVKLKLIERFGTRY